MKEDRARIVLIIDADDPPKKKPKDDGKPRCKKCGKVLTADDLMARLGSLRKVRGQEAGRFRPSPSVAEVFADPVHKGRARRYFTQALALLKAAGVVAAAYAEPEPVTLPRTG